jgi:hypothetical protein
MRPYHERVDDQRFLGSHGLETRFDHAKRRYYLYLRGRLVNELSFSDGEWNSSWPQTAVARWMGKYSVHKDDDIEADDKRREEKSQANHEEVVDFMMSEWIKYGVKGSQAPGPSSIVIDGFKK